ncbi:MAG: hypothetical protein ACK5NS_15450, partial [Denitromonas sp.]
MRWSTVVSSVTGVERASVSVMARFVAAQETAVYTGGMRRTAATATTGLARNLAQKKHSKAPRFSLAAVFMLAQLGLFVLGLIALIAGAEALVLGASRIALSWGISPLVIGLTVVAFGTS